MRLSRPASLAVSLILNLCPNGQLPLRAGTTLELLVVKLPHSLFLSAPNSIQRYYDDYYKGTHGDCGQATVHHSGSSASPLTVLALALVMRLIGVARPLPLVIKPSAHLCSENVSFCQLHGAAYSTVQHILVYRQSPQRTTLACL